MRFALLGIALAVLDTEVEFHPASELLKSGQDKVDSRDRASDAHSDEKDGWDDFDDEQNGGFIQVDGADRSDHLHRETSEPESKRQRVAEELRASHNGFLHHSDDEYGAEDHWEDFPGWGRSLGQELEERKEGGSFIQVSDLSTSYSSKKGRRRRTFIPEDVTAAFQNYDGLFDAEMAQLGLTAESTDAQRIAAVDSVLQKLADENSLFANSESFQEAFFEHLKETVGSNCDADALIGDHMCNKAVLDHLELKHVESADNLKRITQAENSLVQEKSKTGGDSMETLLAEFNTQTDEEKREIKDTRSASETEMTGATDLSKTDLKTEFDEEKLNSQDTMKEFKDEEKASQEEFKDEEDEAQESTEQQQEDFDERTMAKDDELREEAGTLALKVTQVENAVKGFGKESEKTISTREKSIEKYTNTAEKDFGKTKEEKIASKADKEVDKALKVVVKGEERAIGSDTKGGLMMVADAEKRINKETKDNTRLATSEQKVISRKEKEGAKSYDNEMKAEEKVISEGEKGRDRMTAQKNKFAADVGDSKAAFQDNMMTNRQNMREQASETANTLMEQIANAFADVKENIASSEESLRKTLKDGSKGTNALAQVAAQTKMAIAQTLDEAAKGVAATARGVKEQSKAVNSFSSAVADFDQFVHSSLARMMSLEGSAAKETKKVVTMNKARNLAMAQSFTESNKQPPLLAGEVRDWKDEASDSVIEEVKSMSEKLGAAKTGYSKELSVKKREASTLSNSAAAQVASVDALGQQVGQLARDLAALQKHMLSKVTSLNNTVDSRILQMTANFLKRASSSAKAALQSRADTARDEVKDAAGKRALALEEDMKELLEHIQDIDTRDQGHSEEVNEHAAQLDEKLAENAEVIAATQELSAAASKYNTDSQEKMGEGAVAALGLRANTWLSGVMSQSDSALSERVASTKAEEARTLGKASDDFTGYLGSLKDKVEDYFRRNLNNAHEKEQKMAEGAQKESDMITDGGREVEGLYQMLEELGMELQTHAVTIERDAESAIGNSRRSQQQIQDEAKAGIQQELESSKTGLNRVQGLLQGILAGYGQDARGEESRLENEEARSNQAAQAMLAGVLSNMGQNIQQIEAKDKASMVALDDGLKRWADAESNAETKEGIFERNIMSRNAQPSKADGLKASTEVSEDRANAGLNSLGSETKDLGEEAENKVAMAGSESETQAKAAGISTEMRLQGIESTEERAYEQQDARDHALASAVGAKLQDIRKVQLDAGNDQKYVQIGVDSVRNLLNTEFEGLQKNMAYLNTFGQQNMEVVTQSLGEIAALMMKSAHAGEHRFADILGKQGAAEMHLAEIQGSAAFQQLSRIQSADDYSLQTMMENEVLEQWMKDFQDGADVWRKGVETAFSEHEDAAALHAEEVRKTDEEHAAHRAEMEQMGEGAINGMLGTMKVIPTDEIEGGFDQGIAAFKAKEGAVNELDEERIKNLMSMQGSLKEKMQAALDGGNSALRETFKSGGGGAELIKMRSILRKMADMHDAEVAMKMKMLKERQQKFDQNLLMATFGGSENSTDKAPEASGAELDALVEEARQLTHKHEQLEAKRVSAGADISKAFGQLITAMQERKEQQAPSTMVQLKTGAAAAASPRVS